MICVEIGLCMQERTSSSKIIIIAQLIIASLVPLEKAWLREAKILHAEANLHADHDIMSLVA